MKRERLIDSFKERKSEIIIVHKPLPLACFSSSLPFTTEGFAVNVMPYFTLLSEELERYFHFSYILYEKSFMVTVWIFIESYDILLNSSLLQLLQPFLT